MAKTRGKAGQGANTAGRGRLRTRKSSASKALKSESRKPEPAKRSSVRKKVAPTSKAERLKKQLEAARLREREALERQITTADILKVIASSPSDVQPIFDAIATSSKHLISGFSTAVFRFVDGVARLAAFTPITPEADELLRAAFPLPVAEFEPFKVAQGDQPIQIKDTENYPNPRTKEIARARGYRSMLLTPLVSNGQPIGLISVTRTQPGAFADQHVQLLQTFADQAVIAIENARLFNETKEALERQTATADILSVINNASGDLKPVFDTILEKAHELCEAPCGSLQLYEHGRVNCVAIRGMTPSFTDYLRGGFAITEGIRAGLLVNRPVQRLDMAELLQTLPDESSLRATVELGGIGTVVAVPLLKEGVTFGRIVAARREVRPFAERQIDLLQTFADQAAIAIENARLFNEVRAKTLDLEESLQQQTATSEVLQVISSSPGELGPVFETMLHNAMQLCQASHGAIWLRDGEGFRSAALRGAWPEAFVARWRSGTPVRPVDDAPIMRAALTGKPVQIEDLRDSPAYRSGDTLPLAAVEAGIRTIISIPMFKDEECIGSFGLSRCEVRPFTEKQIELVGNFAKQGVIAIENARLLNELRTRTQELSQSLNELRAAQDRLVQTEKLASLGQLTAGIAHEIKNPLNFVNNFSALSVELTDELRDVLKQETLTDKGRSELDELTGLLHDNLGKVVQHGKRADSIVKNMLLHSREGSGERRSADVNALVGESLNLAYHGARVEKPGFAITLKHDLDPDAGALELYPQEITRALLNLIANGFYAAIKRKGENSDGDFEPVLSAATRNLGEAVEIRIRDNGTGIPPEVREKMFNPFFTTKPTGEGTGLGLSMTYDIVVKQHGGRIDVETEPGAFTEFIITLPRGNDSGGGLRAG